MENVKIILMCELYIINRQKDEDAAVKRKKKHPSKCLKYVLSARHCVPGPQRWKKTVQKIHRALN